MGFNLDSVTSEYRLSYFLRLSFFVYRVGILIPTVSYYWG